jgi:hypothetical protein
MSKKKFTTYGLGGYDPSLPNGNIVEEYEIDAPDMPSTADERLDAARQALDAATNLTGPVLAADVADVLTDLRTALED